ncbi:hypothetical protein [Defluviimonas sp. WL0075]|nr:hypothetical protein [Defluviimonas sp. WL0075]
MSEDFLYDFRNLFTAELLNLRYSNISGKQKDRLTSGRHSPVVVIVFDLGPNGYLHLWQFFDRRLTSVALRKKRELSDKFMK